MQIRPPAIEHAILPGQVQEHISPINPLRCFSFRGCPRLPRILYYGIRMHIVRTIGRRLPAAKDARMADNRTNLSGVFAPVVTPFADDEIQYDDLRFNLARLRDSGLKGYLALGSNGEFRSLTEAEQFSVLEVFAAEKGDKVIMVGVSCESTRETIERARRAATMGFEFISVLTPSYFAKQMDGAKLRAYYERIADALTVPILLYNAPGFAGGVQIPPDIVAALAEHPNIAGMKDSSPAGPDRFLLRLHGMDVDFHVLAGSANFFYPSLHLGAVGGIVSLANALPEPCCEVYRMFVAGRFGEARELHFTLAKLNGAVSGTAGVAGVKAAMDAVGFRGGEPRHPLVTVSAEVRVRIREAIADAGYAVL